MGKTPSKQLTDWYLARSNCLNRFIGGRKGWRLPTFEELSSLIEPDQTGPALPPGHPFQNISWEGVTEYWTITDFSRDTAQTLSMRGSGALHGSPKNGNQYSWCVRGGFGYDGH